MTGTLLVVADDASQPGVRLATPPRRRVVVAGRCEQRMGEAHPLGIEFDDACLGGLLEGIDDLCSLALRGDQCSNRWPRERGNQEQHVTTGRREAGKARADDLAETAGEGHRTARGRRCERKLTADLEGKE